ncbi:hypothetical protein [Aquimarina sp. 2201CG5-10]|uniref:hypothetical protein n=1 Tax=Aquimarina callyspongiae TaxID=3098150 RepID=UPI002AB34106|nr:hypothetical protein [Aquimarina sp. 2201CG5-10]MDY8134540.1 hypothetical protein [Aquimarina sp. 2201CG5-10]
MKSISISLFLIVALFNTCLLIAQDKNSDHYLYSINKTDQIYSGKGIDWILNKRDTTQFYLFGEQHGISEIPKLVRFVHNILNEKEQFHLVLEMDEWSAHNISKNGVERVITKYPHSVAFDYDQEIALIKSAEKKSEIWGIDQMVTAIHPFQRLVELAPNESARRLAKGAFLKASLKMGNYLVEPHYDDFEAIKEAFGKELPSEAKEILDNLQISMKIYVTYKAGQRKEISRQVSVELREKFMMNQFDSYIQKKPKQKAIFKMGGAHIIKGIGPNGVETLGNHVIKKAYQNNLNALAIGVFNYHKDLQFVTEDIFKYSDIVLLDCKKYLNQIDGSSSDFSDNNKFLLEGYDAIILFNNSQRDTKSFVSLFQRSFKTGLIKKISIGGVLILICFTLIVPVVLYKLSKSNKTKNYYLYGKLIVQILVASIIAVIIVSLQIYTILYSINSSLIVKSSWSIWIYIALLLTAVYFVYKTILFLKNDGKKKHKIYLVTVTLSYFLLICFLYYWNIGGMISF